MPTDRIPATRPASPPQRQSARAEAPAGGFSELLLAQGDAHADAQRLSAKDSNRSGSRERTRSERQHPAPGAERRADPHRHAHGHRRGTTHQEATTTATPHAAPGTAESGAGAPGAAAHAPVAADGPLAAGTPEAALAVAIDPVQAAPAAPVDAPVTAGALLMTDAGQPATGSGATWALPPGTAVDSVPPRAVPAAPASELLLGTGPAPPAAVAPVVAAPADALGTALERTAPAPASPPSAGAGSGSAGSGGQAPSGQPGAGQDAAAGRQSPGHGAAGQSPVTGFPVAPEAAHPAETAAPAVPGAASVPAGTPAGAEALAAAERPADVTGGAQAPAPAAPGPESQRASGGAELGILTPRESEAARPAQPGVPLERAPRAVAQFVQVAVDRGLSKARINLRPAELGGIEISLQATAGGVAAQLVAESPEAARLLQAAADDLRRALARQDVQLLSLEVSTSGEQQRDASAAGDGRDRAYGGRGEHRGAPSAGTHPDPDPTPSAGTVIELPDGVLVDVLA